MSRWSTSRRTIQKRHDGCDHALELVWIHFEGVQFRPPSLTVLLVVFSRRQCSRVLVLAARAPSTRLLAFAFWLILSSWFRSIEAFDRVGSCKTRKKRPATTVGLVRDRVVNAALLRCLESPAATTGKSEADAAAQQTPNDARRRFRHCPYRRRNGFAVKCEVVDAKGPTRGTRIPCV